MYCLTEIKSGIIAHQVNCLGYMGRGAALAIRKLYPRAFVEYTKYGHKTGNGAWRLGMVQIVRIDDDLSVANLAGQFGISNTRVMTNYEGLSKALDNLRDRANGRQMYFPWHMGCVSAGGDWRIVESMILERFAWARFFSK